MVAETGIFWDELLATGSNVLWIICLILLLRIYKAGFLYLWLLAAILYEVEGIVHRGFLGAGWDSLDHRLATLLQILMVGQWYVSIGLSIVGSLWAIKHLTQLREGTFRLVKVGEGDEWVDES